MFHLYSELAICTVRQSETPIERRDKEVNKEQHVTGSAQRLGVAFAIVRAREGAGPRKEKRSRVHLEGTCVNQSYHIKGGRGRSETDNKEAYSK